MVLECRPHAGQKTHENKKSQLGAAVVIAALAVATGVASWIRCAAPLNEGRIQEDQAVAVAPTNLNGRTRFPESGSHRSRTRPAPAPPSAHQGIEETLLAEVSSRFGPGSLRCPRNGGEAPYDVFDLSSHYTYPYWSSRGIPSRLPDQLAMGRMLGMIEDSDNDALFRVLENLDDAGTALPDAYGNIRPAAEMYLSDMSLSANGGGEAFHYNLPCVRDSIAAAYVADWVMQVLIERHLAVGAGSGDASAIAELAAQVPPDFSALLYDDLSIFVFGDRTAFSPETAASMLGSLDGAQQHAFMARLRTFSYVNGNYRANIGLLLEHAERGNLLRGDTRDELVSIFDAGSLGQPVPGRASQSL